MTKIEYNGSVVATVEGGNTATLPVKDKKMKSDIKITVPAAEVTDSPLPTEVSTEAEMTALLTSGEVGGVYKYTGTTGTYENGTLYVLENEIGTFTHQYTGGSTATTTYEFEVGMTWAEWAESDYDTNYLCAVRSWGLRWGGGAAESPLYLNGVEVSADDLIISGATYTSSYQAGGGGSN